MATKPSEVNLSCFLGILFTIPHDIYYITTKPLLLPSNSKEQASPESLKLNQSSKSTDLEEEDSFDINSFIDTNEDIEPTAKVPFTSFLDENWKQKITNDILQKGTQYRLQFNN